MWQPEPGWVRLPAGPSTAGAWRAAGADGPKVVKRLSAPTPHDPAGLHEPSHPAYWRRSIEVACSGLVEATAGLRALPAVEVLEDEDGATLITPWVEAAENNGLFLARNLGRFTTNTAPSVAWLAHDQLASRLVEVERRGGWSTLARTPVADVADLLWQRRGHALRRLAELPQVLQHGDAIPANLLGRDGEDVVAIDWSSLGTGPQGADLGYLALSVREEFEPLLTAYLGGIGAGGQVITSASEDDVRFSARATIAYTVLTRVDWALSRVASGEGALAGKYRHPSVAPDIRAMQRHFPEIQAFVAAL